MYQSEFPVETPVPIFDPTLLAGIALITLAVAALAFCAGRFTGRKGRDERWRDVPKTIHKAILVRCVAATSAPTGELLRRAEELVDEVEARVGALIEFADCGKALKSLEKACRGQFPKPEAKPEVKAAKPCTCGHEARQDGKHGHEAGQGCGGTVQPAPSSACKAPAPCHCVICCVPVSVGGLALASPQVKISSKQTVIVNANCAPGGAPAPAAQPHACTCGGGGHGKEAEDDKKPEPLEWTEHMRRLRLAVVEFADVWNSPDSLRLLERCQKQLTHTEPAPKAGRGRGEDHGGH